jgi:hypothetical protein
MPVRDDLIQAIESLIQAARAINYDEPSQTNDIYENFIWALCVEAARRERATIRFETVQGSTASSLCFRTAPGAIYSTTSPYTHAVFDFPGSPRLECHVGIRVLGKSGILHECDVAILYQDEAILCRQQQVHPRASQIVVAVECKFYAAAIDLHLGRGFLGLIKEIHTKNRFFVTNSSSLSVQKLVLHHNAEWECDIIPFSDRAIGFRDSIARILRNFYRLY